MSKRDYRLFLTDIRDCSKKILEYTEKKSFEDFTGNQMLVDAVIRNLLCLIAFLGCSARVCDVGNTHIIRKDISLRAQVSEVYYPGSGKDYVGLSQILKSLGHMVDDTVIEAESKRIEENTKATKVLSKIQGVYGSNKEAYLKTFVRVIYAERVLYNEVFLKSKEIHSEQYDVAKKLLENAIDRIASFKKIAREKNLDVHKLRISKKKGIMPLDSEREMPA